MQNIKVVAFSRVLFDPIHKYEFSKRLANFDIFMQDPLPELSGVGTQFIYANGVIQTGERLKGPVLKEVLSLISNKPKKIIFVDDRLSQIESVQKACTDLGISAVCFHFQGANDPPILTS